ncbi:HopJ type III effector protein [Enterovibrio norvegicus]|uniref:HopJ type III effector protein n=1 Tax=Enterovibrio norvegicus TaxID=188144 RepID=UPI0024B04FD1|nr:HopJ type III effector protein [Enterovibrio norvegicus]
MQLNDFLAKLANTPALIEFEDTMSVIDGQYDFSPTRFTNGDLVNKAGQNSGSCKILSFGQLHELEESAVLACFGGYYRDDVLCHPSGNDHQNIRNFMVSGWKGVQFDRPALTPKATVSSS